MIVQFYVIAEKDGRKKRITVKNVESVYDAKIKLRLLNISIRKILFLNAYIEDGETNE